MLYQGWGKLMKTLGQVDAADIRNIARPPFIIQSYLYNKDVIVHEAMIASKLQLQLA